MQAVNEKRERQREFTASCQLIAPEKEPPQSPSPACLPSLAVCAYSAWIMDGEREWLSRGGKNWKEDERSWYL